MAQFIVRVYPAPPRLRVVVDGLTDFDVDAWPDVEPAARRAILDQLHAYLPPRAPPPVDPASVGTLFFEIELVRAARPVPPGPPAPGPHRRSPRAGPDAAPAASND